MKQYHGDIHLLQGRELELFLLRSRQRRQENAIGFENYGADDLLVETSERLVTLPTLCTFVRGVWVSSGVSGCCAGCAAKPCSEIWCSAVACVGFVGTLPR